MTLTSGLSLYLIGSVLCLTEHVWRLAPMYAQPRLGHLVSYAWALFCAAVWPLTLATRLSPRFGSRVFVRALKVQGWFYRRFTRLGRALLRHERESQS